MDTRYSYLISKVEVEPDDNNIGEKSCIVIKEERIEEVDENANICKSPFQNDPAFDIGKVKPEPPSKSVRHDDEDIGSTFCAEDTESAHARLENATNNTGVSRKSDTKKKCNKKQPKKLIVPSRESENNREPVTNNTVFKLKSRREQFSISKESEVIPEANPYLINAKSKIKCKICFEIFGSKLALSRHMTQHQTGKLYSCPICDDPFEELSDVIRHRATHSSEKEKDDKNVECRVCGKKIKRTSLKVKYFCTKYLKTQIESQIVPCALNQ